MSILRRIFPLLLTAALLCACVQMPNTPQDVLQDGEGLLPGDQVGGAEQPRRHAGDKPHADA